MKKNTFNPKIFFIVFLIFFVQNFFAESFRVSKTHIFSVDNEEIQKIGINEAFGIALPKDKTFIEGLEIRFSIPETVAYWTDSVACSVYSDILPIPSINNIDYSGTRTYVKTLPGKLSWVLQIPLKEENSLKSNNYTTKIDSILKPKNDAIFVRFQPVMKGIPEETMNSKISVSVKPILINKGKLNLKFLIEKSQDEIDNKSLSVFVDDNLFSLSNDDILLETGIHNISIISQLYRNEMRTVRIDKAQTTNLEVLLKSIEPTLIITAPINTQVFFDEQQITELGTEFLILEGEHKIKVILGDYEIIKTIYAIKGKTYKADFSVDLQITEE